MTANRTIQDGGDKLPAGSFPYWPPECPMLSAASSLEFPNKMKEVIITEQAMPSGGSDFRNQTIQNAWTKSS